MIKKYDLTKEIVKYLKSVDYVNCFEVETLPKEYITITIDISKTSDTKIMRHIHTGNWDDRDVCHYMLHIVKDINDNTDYKEKQLNDKIYEILNPKTPLQEMRDKIELMLLKDYLFSDLRVNIKDDKIIVEIKDN